MINPREMSRFPNSTELKKTFTSLMFFFSRLMVIYLLDIEFKEVVIMPAYITKLLDKGKKP